VSIAIFRATGRQILEVNAVAELVYGHYAWADLDRHQKIEEAGSGILIAAGLGLTAKHVTKSFFKLDPQYDALSRRSSVLDPQYRIIKRKSEFASLVYQGPYNGAERNWMPQVTWPSHDTDITCMVLEPRSDAAIRVAPTLQFFEWSLLPPKVGSVVTIYGFPGPEINVDAADDGREIHDLAVNLRVDSAYVTEHCEAMKEHGLREFPGFLLDRELPHGFSGGPVLQKGRLVGIFSGPDYVASLWPLGLMTYPDTQEVEHSFAEHFDSGEIRARGWRDVKGRMERLPCEEALAGSVLEHRCTKQHAVLRSGKT
jgi:CBS domain-containing protein